MKYIRNTISLLKYNFNSLLKFEIVYKLLISLIFIPISKGLFNLIMKITGHSFLTLENLKSFLFNPITILFLLVIIVFLTLVTLFDISTIIIIYDASFHKKKINAKNSIKLSIEKCKELLKINNIPVAFMLLFMIPLLNFGVTSNVISEIKIPEFIEDYILANGLLSLALLFVYIILTIVLVRWIFAIHYMVLDNQSFLQARKSSNTLSKGNKWKDIFRFAFIQIVIALIYLLLFIILGFILPAIINSVLEIHTIIRSILLTCFWSIIAICTLVILILANALSYAILSSFFYIHKEKNNEKITEFDYSNLNLKKSTHKKNIIIIVLILIIFSCSTFFAYQVVIGNIDLNYNFKVERNLELTAHRGASVLYPENTMSAFRGAKELGADWIELDVQQTKDHQIVVSHDSNVKRVTGVDKDIINMTYEEISSLDAGSFKDEKFAGEKMPLLSEVIDFANQNNIKLNIELKPTGKEVDFEKEVAELIEKYNFEDKCVVTSLTYSVLENIKKVNPNIKTVYVMTVAIGKITDLEYADSFSVEASNVTYNLVSQVHNNGKQLFVWTVNTKESIQNMIDMKVDNIITDDIVLGKEILKENEFINPLKELIRIIFE